MEVCVVVMRGNVTKIERICFCNNPDAQMTWFCSLLGPSVRQSLTYISGTSLIEASYPTRLNIFSHRVFAENQFS
jgi:hypothetical protein